jgi:hypothetical protein
MTDESVRYGLLAFSYGPGCFKDPASGYLLFSLNG